MSWPDDLPRRPANFQPLTPVSYLERAAAMWPERTAVIDGARHFGYGEFLLRCRKLASALQKAGIAKGDTVAILATNCPEMLEAHNAAPMLGAVLNPINVRLDPRTIAFCLEHGEAKLFLADRGFAATIAPALKLLKSPPLVVEIPNPEAQAPTFGGTDYESFIEGGDVAFAPPGPADEWDAICLLYTSGTTGNPKGALYSHRGAYLAALSNAYAFGLDHRSVYLWTLPMFHCSGWTYTWGVTAAAATHVCLRKVEPRAVFEAVAEHGVTHLCGAPIVLNMLAHAPKEDRRPLPRKVKVATGGAAPPSAVIAKMEEMGFEVLHLYGATETYGPSTLCAPQAAWENESEQARHSLMARQGVPTVVIAEMMIADPLTLEPMPKDGATIGELMVRGNTVMKGYLKNPKATAEALEGEWYRSGDLGVWHADGYIEIKDRSKDIIISGGENISSLEVEEILYRHPDIMEAAVVARPDDKWGETPCAFVTPRPGVEGLTAQTVIDYCRENLAAFKCPRHVVFGPLPKTSTGKIQKFVLRERAREVGQPDGDTGS